MRRCIEIVLATAGGELADAPLDLWPEPSHPPRIFLRPARVTQVLGVEMPWAAIEHYLVAIGATVVSKPDDGRIAVDVPGWRPDLVREIDLIEEVARLHGYDAFPVRAAALPSRQRCPTRPRRPPSRRCGGGMVDQGLFEVSRLPMGPADGDGSVRLANPLSAEDAWLRRRLLPGLVRLVEANWANHVADVRLFEIGTALDRRRARRAARRGATGRRRAHRAARARALDRQRGGPVDLWDLKGRFEAAVALAIPGGECKLRAAVGWRGTPGAGSWARHRRSRPTLRPGPPRCSASSWSSTRRLDRLPDSRRSRRRPRGSGAGAASARGCPGRTVEELLRGSAARCWSGSSVESDYRGPEFFLPRTRSVAFRLAFRAPDRTLRDAEVDAVETTLLAVLASDLGVRRRDAGTSRAGE